MSCCTERAPLRMTMTKENSVADKFLLPKLKCQRNCENCKSKEENKSVNDKKKLVLVPLLVLVAFIQSMAQDAALVKTFWDDPFTHPMLPLYCVTALVFITVILVMVVALYMLKILNLMVKQAEKEKAERTGIVPVAKASWFQQWWDKINAVVPVAQEQDIDMGHSFDGIRELDNHLPPWWKWLFYATIVWAVIYFTVYHLSESFPLSVDEYQNELAVAEEKARILRASQPAADIDVNTLEYISDAALIEKGKVTFLGNCVACHRNDGGGNTIGPNLTDNYWLHGGGIKNIFTTIKTGVVEKGMPAWGKAMSPQEVRNVAFYIMSLQGSNPANGKAPQGELYEEATKPDSLSVKSDSLIVKN